MLRRQAVRETISFVILVPVSSTSQHMAEPHVFATSLRQELEQLLDGVLIFRPEHSSDTLEACLWLYVERVVKEGCGSHWRKLPHVSCEADV